MARRRSKKRKGERLRVGEARWLLAAIVLAMFAYFLKDTQGIGYGFLGSYIWLVAFIFTFFIGIFYFSQFILPLDWRESWFEGMRLSLAYNFPRISRLLGIQRTDQKRAPGPRGEATVPRTLVKQGAAILDSHTAMTLTQDGKPTRAVGPGFIRLNKGEIVDFVIDLRDQRAETEIEALTRDGIPVKTELSVIFHAKRLKGRSNKRVPYPYDPAALTKISLLDRTGDERTPLNWAKLISNFAESATIAEIARYTFDELNQQHLSDGAKPLTHIRKSVLSTLSTNFGRRGVEMKDFRLGYLQPPDRIIEQKIINWKADWQQRTKVQEARNEANIERGLRLARARAQVDIIDNIAQNIESMRRDGRSDLRDIVAYRMIAAMEEAISDEVVQGLVTEETRTNLSSLEKWLRGYPGRSSARADTKS